MSNLQTAEGWESPLKLFENFLMNWVVRYGDETPPEVARLVESMKYSLTNGGKRFRPLLALFTAEALGKSQVSVLPFACAVELIHTYSLVHDDLPSMDNDDMRRGQPTNHKVFGESTAILAGDNLLTEAFGLVANHYTDTPKLALEVISDMSVAAGGMGMVGGQMIDLSRGDSPITVAEITKLHQLKTGALIGLSVVGAAKLLKASPDEIIQLRRYAEELGVAFQIADDIEDAREGKIENFNFVHLLGAEQTIAKLKEVSQAAEDALHGLSNPKGLLALIRFNHDRALLN
ncbi:MAG: polyprenyl synthetase family protein [Bdellovibrionales bacterium]|nr:polyprenyl synthetase family protein [Bdellovibrionales bacterium]